MLSRRALRIKAMQNLYAFYMCDRANYELALKDLYQHLEKPIDAFHHEPRLLTVPEKEYVKACFEGFVREKPYNGSAVQDPRFVPAAIQAATAYKQKHAQDLVALRKNLSEDCKMIEKTYLRVWGLLLAWHHIAEKKTEKISRSAFDRETGTTLLPFARNQFLEKLQQEPLFQKQRGRYGVSWQENMGQIESWFKKIVQEDERFKEYCACSSPAAPGDIAILEHLIYSCIFKNSTIQSFFASLDLRWSENRHVVKKILRQSLQRLSRGVENALLLDDNDFQSIRAEEAAFYQKITESALEAWRTCDEVIAAKVQNWDINRIILVDKVILILALCEMHHCVEVPVKVTINEYVDIAKNYSTPKSGVFVNGILDTFANTQQPFAPAQAGAALPPSA